MRRPLEITAWVFQADLAADSAVDRRGRAALGSQGGGSGNAAGGGNGPRRNGQPRGEANGNVALPEVDPNRAPRDEPNGNVALRNPVVPRDDDD